MSVNKIGKRIILQQVCSRKLYISLVFLVFLQLSNGYILRLMMSFNCKLCKLAILKIGEKILHCFKNYFSGFLHVQTTTRQSKLKKRLMH